MPSIDGATMTTLEKRNGFIGSTKVERTTASPNARVISSGIPGPEGSRRRVSLGDKIGPASPVDNASRPSKSFISPNITPRSGARKARAESTSPTLRPTTNGVPRAARPLSIEKRHINGSGPPPVNGDTHRSPTSPKPHPSGSVSIDGPGSSYRAESLHERSDTAMSAPVSHDTPRFFHVDDAPPLKILKYPASDSPSESWPENKVGTRANGLPSRGSSALSNSPTPDEQRPKFFYANDVPEAKSPPPRHAMNGTVSRPILQTIHSGHTTQAPNPFRPSSPLKEEFVVDPDDSLETSPLSNLGSDQDRSTSGLDGARASLSRTLSLTSPSHGRNNNHVRQSSTLSNSTRRARKSSITKPTNDHGESIRSPSLPRLSRFSTEFQESSTPAEGAQGSGMLSQPQSPTKPQSQLDRMNELAAGARRERKVLDLEISNSSLLAINQTLEREMRKMKGELRHFRRLSRTGRLSSTWSSAKKNSSMSQADTALESDEKLSETDEDDEDGDGSSSLSTSQKSFMGNRAVLARFNDAKVEPLDLSAHHSMLSDGQKLNQSIKRCLGYSENLLTAGKRALEVQARPIDIERLGPRVLTPDEVEDTVIERRQGLLTPSITELSNTNPWERSLAKVVSLSSEIQQLNDPDPVIPIDGTTNGQPLSTSEDTIGLGINEDQEEELSKSSQEGQIVSSSADDEKIPPEISDSAIWSPHSSIPDENPQHPSNRHGDANPTVDESEAETIEKSPHDTTSTSYALSRLEQNSSAQTNQVEGVELQKAASLEIPTPETIPSTVEATPESANTPGNRSSITMYLSSFWTGAASLRPP